MEVALEVGRIASAAGSVEQRAEAILAPLRRLVPFEAAGIYLLDPDLALHIPVVSCGYDDAVATFFGSPAHTDDIERLGLRRCRAALRLGDLPVGREQIRAWSEYLWPAGFREGLGVALFTHDDGRHVGILGMNTDTARHPTEAARDFIGTLAPTIANAVDPLQSVTRLAAMVDDAVAGTVLTRAGSPLPLPGRPPDPLLVAGSPVVVLAVEWLAAGRVYSTFLQPRPAGQADQSYLVVTTLACPTDSPHDPLGVVLLSPAGDLHGLSARQLEILGLIVDGWPNWRIAAALGLSQRTVNTHLERILARLGVPTRTVAAVRALRLGLFIPSALQDLHAPETGHPRRGNH